MGVFAALDADIRDQTREFSKMIKAKASALNMTLDTFPARPANTSMARPEHFTRLEELLEQLALMAEQEIQGQPINPGQQKILLKMPEDLKVLSLIESNVDEPPEPMGLVAEVLNDVVQKKRHYAAVGRPLEILVVVPYEGHLFWSRGSVYSFFQLESSQSEPLTDLTWKSLAKKPIGAIQYIPYLKVEPETWTADQLAQWLKPQFQKYSRISGVYGGGPELSGYISSPPGLAGLPPIHLTPDALALARRHFNNIYLEYGARATLFHWLQDSPQALPAALDGLDALVRELDEDSEYSSEPGRLWVILCLRLLDGRVPESARPKLVKLLSRLHTDDSDDIKYLCHRITELIQRGRVSTWRANE